MTVFDCLCAECGFEWQSEGAETPAGRRAPAENVCPRCGCIRVDFLESDPD